MEPYKTKNTTRLTIAVETLAISIMAVLVFISGCAPAVKPKEDGANEVEKGSKPKNIVKPSETEEDVKSKETITSKNRNAGNKASEAPAQ